MVPVGVMAPSLSAVTADVMVDLCARGRKRLHKREKSQHMSLLCSHIPARSSHAGFRSQVGF